MKTPGEIVAESIVAALREEKLITEASALRLSGQIARGEVKESDWRVLLSEAMPEGEVNISKRGTSEL
jgi:hypothetical protein